MSNKRNTHWNRLVENTIKRVLQEEDEARAGTAPPSFDAKTDINGKGQEIVDAILNHSQHMYDLLAGLKGWGKGALKDNGIVDGASLLAKAKEIYGDDLADLKKGVEAITTKLDNAGGFVKAEMPALEYGDANIVADALDADTGDLGVDFQDQYNTTPDFEDYISETRRWGKLAGLLTEINDDKRFPYPGDHQTFPGASKVGEDAELTDDLSNVKKDSPADKFLKKGKGTGDKIEVSTEGGCTIGNMMPTQKNVKLVKSLLFAFTQDPAKDPTKAEMGAYLADAGGKEKYILDGHHRWSGQFLRGNLDQEMTKLVTIKKPSSLDMNEFLTMLTVLGTAMGRATKK